VDEFVALVECNLAISSGCCVGRYMLRLVAAGFRDLGLGRWGRPARHAAQVQGIKTSIEWSSGGARSRRLEMAL
jgi:hypothetical protein